MTYPNIPYRETVPQNSIGVSSKTEGYFTTPSGKVIPIETINNNYENANHAVDELIKLKGIETSKKARTILEYIAKCVLKKNYPTSEEIENSLGIKYQVLKKNLFRLRKKGLIVLYPIKEGHYNRYSLFNMQDFKLNFEKEYHNSKSNTNSHSPIDKPNTVIEKVLLQMTAVDGLSEAEGILFHHISLSTEFDSSDHYRNLKWKKNERNKGKSAEFRISRHRSSLITAYPTNKITLVIKCSKDPYDILSDDGYINFVSDCGEILGLLKDQLGVTQIFQDNISDWKVMQIDCAIDIREAEIDSLIKTQQENKLVSFIWAGAVRVKDLNQIFQIYLKRLPTKGVCLRLEKRLSFNKNQPNLSDLINHYKHSNED